MKLNSHYQLYSSNQLFIYAFKSLTKNDLYKCFQVDLTKFKLNFDTCYINCIDRMYICDFNKRIIKDTIFIELPELIWIKKKALEISISKPHKKAKKYSTKKLIKYAKRQSA